jgi:hypothetical protein
MAWLTKSEFLQIHTVAKRLIAELNANQWNIPAGNRPATAALKSARLKNVQVSLGAVFAPFHDLSKIVANSTIEIKVPNTGYRSALAARQLPIIRRMIYSVLVHECVHVAQRAVAPAQFAQATSLERQLRAIASPTPVDWFELYVGQPLEQEARAHQATAEIFDDLGSGSSRANFDLVWPKTQLHIRTEALIGPRARALPLVAFGKIAKAAQEPDPG